VQLIELSQGKVAQVDDEDYLTLSQHTWHDELAKQHYGEFAKLNFPEEHLCKTV
jgi:hypothetical protein